MPGNFKLPPVTIIYSWPTPNYTNPVERQWLMPYSIVFLIVSSTFLGCRFWLRARKQAGSFGLDDSIMFVGWIFALGMTVVACIGTNMGIGRHTWDIPYKNYPALIEIGYLEQIFFLISLCATKLSVLLFYRRMVKNTYSRRWIYILWVAIGFNLSAGIATLLVYLNICKPLNAYWMAYQFGPTPYTREYTCISSGRGLTLSTGCISVFTDMYAVAIPYLMLKQYKLDVSTRQKVALNIVFALGWFATGCGIARTYYLYRMDEVDDLSWTGYNLLVWAVAEVHVGIICACAPSLRALFRTYVNRSSHRASCRVSQRIADGGEDGGERSTIRDSTRSILPKSKPVPSLPSSPTSPTAPICWNEKDRLDVMVKEPRTSGSENNV